MWTLKKQKSYEKINAIDAAAGQQNKKIPEWKKPKFHESSFLVTFS